MKIHATLHNHCNLCDGLNTPEEMLEAAIAAGFSDFGMSCHGYAPFDPDYSMPGEEEYLEIMAKLRQRYANILNVWTGVEEDFFAPSSCPEKYDYIIGDVHYAEDKKTGRLIDIDGPMADYERACRDIYHGSYLDMAKGYYENMVKAAEKRPTVLGHFDIIVKNNLNGRYFDEESGEYMRAAEQALEACAACGTVFEVNTGAVIKSRRQLPYPAPFLLKRLQELGGSVTLSADCHDARYLTGCFDLAEQVIKEAGFTSVLQWIGGKFREIELD